MSRAAETNRKRNPIHTNPATAIALDKASIASRSLRRTITGERTIRSRKQARIAPVPPARANALFTFKKA